MDRGVSGQFLKPEPGIKEGVQPILAGHRKRLGSELYFVECSTKCIETNSEATGLATQNRLGTKEVMLVQLSFTSCDIWIALRGRGVTFEGGRI